MNRKLVYVGGKFGGDENNKILIEKAIRYLRMKDPNAVYVSPMHCFGYLYEDTEYLEGLDYCLSLLNKCDSCILLNNWEDSTGAKIEYGFCKGANIPIEILEIDTMLWACEGM